MNFFQTLAPVVEEPQIQFSPVMIWFYLSTPVIGWWSWWSVSVKPSYRPVLGSAGGRWLSVFWLLWLLRMVVSGWPYIPAFVLGVAVYSLVSFRYARKNGQLNRANWILFGIDGVHVFTGILVYLVRWGGPWA